MALLVKRQDELLAELKAAADEGFPRAKEEWERSVTAWGNAYFHWSMLRTAVSLIFFYQKRSRRRAKWRARPHQLMDHLLLELRRYLQEMIVQRWMSTRARMGREKIPRRLRIHMHLRRNTK
jgi:hypothetical protein